MSGRTRRVLVVGSYPPIPVPGAAAAVAEVKRAWAERAEVTVVAPRLCASHLTVPVYGVLAGRRLTNVARVTGIDRVVVVLEEGYPLPPRTGLLQVASAAALARALKGFDHVRLVQAGRVRMAPGIAGRLRAVADEYVTVDAGPAPPGVTPLGPAESPPAERLGRLAGRVADRVLGRRAPQARAAAGRARRALRSAIRPGA